MIKFIVLANKQGHPRIVKYYDNTDSNEKRPQEIEVIKKILMRSDKECSFFDYKNFRIVYKKYAALFFIAGVDEDENELSILEFIHNIVETFDKYFNKVCEMDLMFNLDRAHMILDEMIQGGRVVESNKNKILASLYTMDQAMRN